MTYVFDKTCPKDNLSIETAVDWPVNFLNDINTPLYNGHLSTETTNM
jgi:hypothetical protein